MEILELKKIQTTIKKFHLRGLREDWTQQKKESVNFKTGS